MKKPKVWDIAVLTGVVLAIVLVLNLGSSERTMFYICTLINVYFIAAIVMLSYAFLRQLKYNIYSYNTIYYVGFAIFVAFVMISHITMMPYFVADPGTYGLPSIISNLAGTSRTFIFATFPFILVFSAALCASNISLIKHEGKRLVNLLGIILSFMMIAGALFIYFFSYSMSGSAAHVMRLELISQLASTIYLYCECMLIGAIIANVLAAKRVPAPDKDFIIILGCGIMNDGSPTPLLRGRVDKALELYDRQLAAGGKVPVFITSGGKGPDEVISESECMKRYLIKKGIPENRIILEDKSCDTFENMKFSKEKLIALGREISSTKIAFSTNKYHVFRSGLYAKRVKLQAEGIGADTKWYFWPNASVREFVGLMTEHRGKQALVLLGMIAIYVTLTIITFRYF